MGSTANYANPANGLGVIRVIRGYNILPIKSYSRLSVISTL